MRLWGKVAKIALLLMAAGCALMAMFMPEDRWQASLAAIVAIVVAVFGVPALVRLLSSFSGDEEVLANGVAGSATITALAPTRWHFNDYPIFRFSLSVEASGASYPVELKQAVDREVLDRLAAGAIVGVRVDRTDHKKVVIDWSEPIRGTHSAVVVVDSAEQQATATQSSSHQFANGSLLPFLRSGFLIFALIFFRLSCEEGYYEDGGARVQGIVLEKTYSPATHSTGGTRGSSSKHYVRYRFTTREGRTIEGQYDVLPGTWQQLKKGAPVTIEYLPDSPGTNRIPEQRARSMTWAIMAFVLLAVSAVLFIIFRRQRQSRSQA